jgi:hypothetical protein
VIGLRVGRSPERHDGIADVFVERAQIAKQNVGHGGEILIQQIYEIVGREALGERGEIADVAEHHGQVFDFATGTNVFVRIFLDERDHSGRKVLRKCAADFPFLALFVITRKLVMEA